MYEQHGRLVFQTRARLIDLPLPRLNGRHQIDNAGTAIAAASLPFGEALTTRRSSTVSPTPNGRRGSSGSRRRARTPMSPTAPRSGSTAATTPPAAKSSPHALAELDERVPRAVHLIFGMMETKDAHAFIAPFKGLVERIYTVPIPDEPNAFDAEALAEIAGRRLRGRCRERVPDALPRSAGGATAAGRVLICGSLYLAGHVLKLHG